MKTIIEMAREAGIRDCTCDGTKGCLERFAALVRAEAQAEEREACAKVVGDFAKKWWSIHCDTNKHMETTRKAHDDFCALQAAIRARGNT